MDEKDFRKKVLNMVNSADFKDLEIEIKLTYEGEQFMIRFPGRIAGELKLKKGEK